MSSESSRVVVVAAACLEASPLALLLLQLLPTVTFAKPCPMDPNLAKHVLAPLGYSATVDPRVQANSAILDP